MEPAETAATPRPTRWRYVLVALALVFAGAVAYAYYGIATAETRVKAICAQIVPGMSFGELREFARANGLLTPARAQGTLYLAESRSFGRHACKVALERGAVTRAEHNYAD